jgi:hypothetical protein
MIEVKKAASERTFHCAVASEAEIRQGTDTARFKEATR